MIARIWRGATRPEDGDRYLEYLERTGLPDYRGTEGNRGVYVMRRDVGGRAEFTLISLWESMESIRAFAGDDVDNARYYPEDDRFLLEKTPTVEHHEVVVTP